ncbi:hypothetical protein GCM10011575_45880 [Microlunatus endophyticus]|uniref:Ribbon-helix-helix protein, copG family n=1 Tax=Microlunatus endophyticus TaxID=1716077 RepID=A0A917SJY9_9ACTN|nr:hypothetical protein [Microlunatus endophyticus]GGL82460.1 hypothetical protein GCM10011575_45880 [Microlunatus endophyticus]
MVSPTPVRFPPELDREISDLARRTGTSKSSVVVRAAAEWLRMQSHPRITFLTTNTGERRAALLSGPQVWTVAEAWSQHSASERTTEIVAVSVGLSPADVEAALTYWAAYRDEIDQLLERHQADQDAALRAWEQRQELRAI